MPDSAVVTPDFIAFAARCEAAVSLNALETIWRARLGELGFAFIALGAHVDPLRPERATYVFQNYPEEWIAHFSERKYHLIDPVFRAADAGARDFVWTDPEFREPLSWRQRRILGEASELGLRHGRTHTLAPIDLQRASGSLVAAEPDLPEQIYDLGKIANIIVHHRAVQLCTKPAPVFAELQRRERQALELCASGLTDAEIAFRLGIGVATVRRHIERARVRLGATTRIQAAARAIASGQIKPIV